VKARGIFLLFRIPLMIYPESWIDIGLK